MSTHAPVTLFLCGDVMTGRGIDQILAHPSLPHLYESHATSALDYVALAERANGPIPRPVDDRYVWGVVPGVLDRVRPDARIVNLETSITTSEDAEPKGINYRMHPRNIGVLTTIGIDCCVLANNHVLDWGVAGLVETLDTLEQAGISVAGAGRNRAAACAPAILEIGPERRVLVFAFGSPDAGVNPDWAAGPDEPGVCVLPDFSDDTTDAVRLTITQVKRPGDIAVASIHWGSNWGFAIPPEHRRFAHALIDRAHIDVVHGHSSHHPRAIEIYNGRLILYGCGDFLNDYEGIGGYEQYRGELTLMYFATLDAATGALRRITMTPLRMRRFRL
ncbi:MAG TPA: CapA family protein, partial [Gemmatimonadaceae bacterium]